MVETTGSDAGRTWQRGDEVILLRDWLGARKGEVGTVINLMEKSMSPGHILLVEWRSSIRMSVEDDLVERLPPRAYLHD
jgi:hypothetical protein